MFKTRYRNRELVVYHTINGKWHREDGPAIENHEGDKYWFKNGKLHRLDGPAAEYFDEQKEWYIDDTEYTEEEYKKILKTMPWRK